MKQGIEDLRGAWFRLALAIAVAVGLAACGQGNDEANSTLPKSAEAAATQLETAFQQDPQALEKTEAFGNALQERNFEQAYERFNSLQEVTATNIHQVMAVENAYRRLQADVLAAMEAGDPNARRVWERMKRAGSN